MAQIRVREKNPTEGTEPAVLYVDEAWVDRWPDDFERVDEPDAPAAQPAVEQPAAAPAPPAPEPPARGRF